MTDILDELFPEAEELRKAKPTPAPTQMWGALMRGAPRSTPDEHDHQGERGDS